MTSAFPGSAEVMSGLLHTPVPVERWELPSALDRLAVGGLAGHLAPAVFNVERWLDKPSPLNGTVVDAVGYFLCAG